MSLSLPQGGRVPLNNKLLHFPFNRERAVVKLIGTAQIVLSQTIHEYAHEHDD